MSQDGDSDDTMVDDGKSHVTFATESVVSEFPVEPDKYDNRIDKDEEKLALQKMKGNFDLNEIKNAPRIFEDWITFFLFFFQDSELLVTKLSDIQNFCSILLNT